MNELTTLEIIVGAIMLIYAGVSIVAIYCSFKDKEYVYTAIWSAILLMIVASSLFLFSITRIIPVLYKPVLLVKNIEKPERCSEITCYMQKVLEGEHLYYTVFKNGMPATSYRVRLEKEVQK